ncbi:MAG: VanZ family protein [Deltaproteobacteria bacterium]|nr:VanZ family protein [Deltaproteobacteria bacterium]
MAIVIFVLSSIPGTAFPEIHFRLADKIVHALIYAALAVCLAIPLHRVKVKSGWGWVIAIATVIAGLYGITDEIHQRFTPFRSSDPWDVVADTVGALIGTAVYAGVVRARARRE